MEHEHTSLRSTSGGDQGFPNRHPSSEGYTEQTTRRRALAWLIRRSFAAFAAAFAIPALALRTLRQEVQMVEAGDLLVYAAGDRAGAVLNSNDIAVGSSTQAFPQDKAHDSQNLIQVVRLSEDADGFVAYSAICTHLGCSVLANLSDEGHIFCPCHGSAFDPAEDAAVVTGPAGRALPGLPIEVQDDGTVIAGGDFLGEVGPD